MLNNIIYIAAFLLPEEAKKITDFCFWEMEGAFHENIFCHHTTIQYVGKKPFDSKWLKENIGKEVTLKLNYVGYDKDLCLVVVECKDIVFHSSSLPHITVSTAKGIKPFASNNYIKTKKLIPIETSFLVKAKIGYFDGEVKYTLPV